MSRRLGFTFIEVLACLLILSLGLAAAFGLALYIQLVAVRAQAKSTAMPTAISVATDPLPLMHQTLSQQWKSGTGTTSGWVNGYYVIRTELSGTSQPCAGFESVPVSVDVYDGSHGIVASYTSRQIRQAPTP